MCDWICENLSQSHKLKSKHLQWVKYLQNHFCNLLNNFFVVKERLAVKTCISFYLSTQEEFTVDQRICQIWAFVTSCQNNTEINLSSLILPLLHLIPPFMAGTVVKSLTTYIPLFISYVYNCFSKHLYFIFLITCVQIKLSIVATL